MTFRRIGASLALFLSGLPAVAGELPIDKIRLPEGFSIEILARVPNARQMALGDGNVLYVGSSREGKVHAVQLDSQYRATRTTVIASDLTMPVGVAFRDGNLYVSAVDRILRYDGMSKRLAHPPAAVTIRDDLPKERHHGWKFIAFSPDGRALCTRRCPVQYLQAGPGAFCVDCEHEAGW